MKILHYSLGFPPYRSGGMIKFCVDLMQEQRKEGHEVTLLWPGQINCLGGKVRIRQLNAVNGIGNLEIINPLPVAYDEGISDIHHFIRPADAAPFMELLNKLKPDVIHIHTLMGLHRAFISTVSKMGVRTVFTTHDYYPFCPKLTMFCDGAFCSEAESCEHCPQCNATAMPLWMVTLMQSGLYRAMKDVPIIRKLRKRHRDGFLGGRNTSAGSSSLHALDGQNGKDVQGAGNGRPQSSHDAEMYKTLRSYYVSMLRDISVIHFNSTVAKSIYDRFMDVPCSAVIPISHADIRDSRRIKDYGGKTLRLTYLGAQSQAKGYFLLTEALDKLWMKRRDFCLHVFFTPMVDKPYIIAHTRYDYEQQGSIMDQTDALIAPSLWPETFGYTVPEALSFGVPVIIGDMVGAKDILASGAGIIVNGITPEKLMDAIDGLTFDKLHDMNRAIVKKQSIITIEEMAKNIEKECYQWAQ